jgi:hypothetical protein
MQTGGELHWSTFNRICIISQKTAFFINTAVRTSNPTNVLRIKMKPLSYEIEITLMWLALLF